MNKESQYVNTNKQDILYKLEKLNEANAILQHHDAVTGTERWHVTEDYISILFNAINDINVSFYNVLSETSVKDTFEKVDKYKHVNGIVLHLLVTYLTKDCWIIRSSKSQLSMGNHNRQDKLIRSESRFQD